MIFIIGISHFHRKSEHKQVMWNKIKQGMCKYDSISHYLQSSTLFKRLLKFVCRLKFITELNNNSS